MRILLLGILLVAVVLALTSAIIAMAPYLAIAVVLAIVGYMLLNQGKGYSGEEDGAPEDKDPP